MLKGELDKPKPPDSPTNHVLVEGRRRKSSIAAMGDCLILQYLVGPDRTMPFYKYCDMHSKYLGKKNTKERKSSENKKHDLRRKLVRAPESFIDQLFHFGLCDLAQETSENLVDLVLFHKEARARNRKTRPRPEQKSDYPGNCSTSL